MQATKQIVVSADGHCGADIYDYKPYLDPQYRHEFDAWADAYVDPWKDLDDATEHHRVGVASFQSDLNWDSDKRLAHLEQEGIAAEVLFPNTVPPFFPSGVIGAPAPGTPDEYEYRFAGVQAHNRWLADFCAMAPGRRAGIAQVFFNDVDRALDEIRWAKDHGLRGVLLPPDHMLRLSNLHYPALNPVWALCEELDMPLHRHGTVPAEAPSELTGDAGAAIAFSEGTFYANRPMVHLILAGVFDRYPRLKLVMTENQAAGVLPVLQQVDYFVQYARKPGTLGDLFAGKATRAIGRLPSEYLVTNIYHGSFFDSNDIGHRHVIGVDRMMWGADFPHHEGTSPYSREALRANFAHVDDAEVRQMISQTALAVYDLDEALLQTVADRIGPTLEEIHTPLSPDDLPGTGVICPTFGDDFGRLAVEA
jgi:predicted TIM-barrel fold metal-dependent hydrolase